MKTEKAVESCCHDFFYVICFVLLSFQSGKVDSIKGFTKKTTSMMCCMHCNSHQETTVVVFV